MRDNERIIVAIAALSKQFKETAKELIEADASPSLICGVTNFWGELNCLANSLDDNCSRDRGIGLIHSAMSEDLGFEILKQLDSLGTAVEQSEQAIRERLG